MWPCNCQILSIQVALVVSTYILFFSVNLRSERIVKNHQLFPINHTMQTLVSVFFLHVLHKMGFSYQLNYPLLPCLLFIVSAACVCSATALCRHHSEKLLYEMV